MKGEQAIPRRAFTGWFEQIAKSWSRHFVGTVPEAIGYRYLAMSLGLGMLLCGLLLARSIVDTDGFLSPDSSNYLSLVANLNEGRGFIFAGDGRFPARLHHFAEWPVGYPYLIHLVCAVTGATPFLGSKLVNAALLLASAALLGMTFGRKGPLFVLVLALASYLDIFAYTWSEVPFIFLLLSAAVLLAGFDANPGRTPFARSLLLALCCAGLFLCRYVGVFAISLIVIAVILSLSRRRYGLACFNLFLLAAVILFVSLYLRNNVLWTHYATGMPRLPPTDSAGERLAMLARALWSEAVLPLATFDFTDWRAWLIALIEMLGLFAVWQSVRGAHAKALQAIRVDALSLSFFVVGSLYLGAIISLRWVSEFDPYDFRLLGPGTLMLLVAALRVALLSWPAASRAIALFAGTMAVLSVGLAIGKAAYLPGPGYFANARAVEARYAEVPGGAVVLFGNDHVRYLRPDLFVTLPVCPPWFDGMESWNHFLMKVDKRKPVFLDMNGPALDAGGCERTVQAFLARQPPGQLIRLRIS